MHVETTCILYVYSYRNIETLLGCGQKYNYDNCLCDGKKAHGGSATMHTWLGFTRHMRVYHVRNTVTHFELDISRCTSSTEARQASVSSRVQAAFQSWVGNERHMSLFGNLV